MAISCSIQTQAWKQVHNWTKIHRLGWFHVTWSLHNGLIYEMVPFYTQWHNYPSKLACYLTDKYNKINLITQTSFSVHIDDYAHATSRRRLVWWMLESLHTCCCWRQHSVMAKSTEKTAWLTVIQLFLHPLNLTTLNSYTSLSSCDREIRPPETVTIIQNELEMSTWQPHAQYTPKGKPNSQASTS
jgi:hypothetical protein